MTKPAKFSAEYSVTGRLAASQPATQSILLTNATQRLRQAQQCGLTGHGAAMDFSALEARVLRSLA